MADEHTPTTERVRDLFTWAYAWRPTDEPGSTDLSRLRASNQAEFDRWLAAYEASIRERIAQDINDKTPDGRKSQAFCAGMDRAARIARGATR
ncbi:hypothetical protein ASE27_10235 [Oerskovia sp. Root918]|uniref:hypothetical protein n=1 Tax=Oerskovia sp. Root918 TaxID=1736607 RepID=UPI0006FBB5CB|nr:hypothetical protein [Oerskovia sp. Root918]KRD36825.1 hypothetical protein ASE27_10235 [Oerskovia sp. Root918]